MGTPIVPTSGLQEQRTCLYGREWRFFMGEDAAVSRMLRAGMSCRYSSAVWADARDVPVGLREHLRLCLVEGTTCRTRGKRTSAPRYFLDRILSSKFALSRLPNYIHWQTASFHVPFSQLSSFIPLYFSKYVLNPPSKSLFAIIVDEMCRWDCVITSYRALACIMIAGSWRGLGHSVW